jgi:acyl-CoA thioesterase I
LSRSLVGFLLALTVVGACADSPDEATSVPSDAPSDAESATPSVAPTASATPMASPSPTSTPHALLTGTYLALGDSLAVGVGATAPADFGYVGRLFASLRGDDDDAPLRTVALRNLAVGGETSESMIAGGQLAAAVQAITAAEPPVALVTLDIGGNDLLRLLATETCQSAPLAQECLALLAGALESFEANYRRIVGDVATALDEHAPDARLAVMTYFNPFSGTDAAYEAAAELALLGTDGRVDCDAVSDQARGMNDIIACVGEELNATPVDIGPAFRGLGLELTHIGAEDIHANDRGYEVIAEAFLDALRR